MVTAPAREEGPGFLGSCLVESDPKQEKNARRGKRRALLTSIVLQILIVAGLILIPLLGKGENIISRVLLYPSIPYAPGGSSPHPTNPAHPIAGHSAICRYCFSTVIPDSIVTHDSRPPEDPGDSVDFGPGIPGVSPGEAVYGGLAPTGPRRDPPPVEEHRTPAQTLRRKMSEPVQAAMLIHRVQPEYPTLAKQLHREGRVELHAIIATDGTIQSIEVISGDPLFIQSSLAAVREWRYRPTILDGQPIEIDTRITVVYTLTH